MFSLYLQAFVVVVVVSSLGKFVNVNQVHDKIQKIFCKGTEWTNITLGFQNWSQAHDFDIVSLSIVWTALPGWWLWGVIP